jgi:hypothetical protein
MGRCLYYASKDLEAACTKYELLEFGSRLVNLERGVTITHSAQIRPETRLFLGDSDCLPSLRVSQKADLISVPKFQLPPCRNIWC